MSAETPVLMNLPQSPTVQTTTGSNLAELSFEAANGVSVHTGTLFLAPTGDSTAYAQAVANAIITGGIALSEPDSTTTLLQNVDALNVEDIELVGPEGAITQATRTALTGDGYTISTTHEADSSLEWSAASDASASVPRIILGNSDDADSIRVASLLAFGSASALLLLDGSEDIDTLNLILTDASIEKVIGVGEHFSLSDALDEQLSENLHWMELSSDYPVQLSAPFSDNGRNITQYTIATNTDIGTLAAAGIVADTTGSMPLSYSEAMALSSITRDTLTSIHVVGTDSSAINPSAIISNQPTSQPAPQFRNGA